MNTGGSELKSVEVSLETGTLKGRLLRTWSRVQQYRQTHALQEMAAFFSAGFLFDVFTLSRIDDGVTLIQQGVYLALLGGLLALEQRQVLRNDLSPWLTRVLQFGEDAIHFLFGSLLSSFALFYFKSASGLTALVFVVLVFGLLVANELPRFRKLGPIIRLAIFSFAITSYFAYLLPVLLGFLSPWLFFAATLIAGLFLALGYLTMRRWGQDRLVILQRAVLPGLLVQAVLLGLFFLKAIPPVPLSLTYLGIYHGVESAEGKRLLLHQRPWWRVWHNGDQLFIKRPGDTLYAFAQIFAPTTFKDRLFVRWSKKEQGQWIQQDAIPIVVTGARSEGYRATTYKKNYTAGEYRAEIETDDGRTVGSIQLTVEDAPAMPEGQPYPPRVFGVDTY